MPRNRAALANIYKSDGMAASSPQKLVVLLFERIGIDLQRAIEALEEARIEQAHRALVNAQDIVFELQVALDSEIWDGATDLHAIYQYVQSLLVEANTTKSVQPARQCLAIVTPLIEAWQEAYQSLQPGTAKPAVPIPAAVGT